MTVTRTQPGSVWSFLVERFLPVYPIYLTLWGFAVEAMVTTLTGAGPWRPDRDTALKVLALLAAGAFLRMVDDQKDLAYDTVHNPTRPLVQGRIGTAQLRRAMVPAAAIVVLAAAAVSPPSAAVLAIALGYGLALWWIELNVAAVRDNPLLNLAVVARPSPGHRFHHGRATRPGRLCLVAAGRGSGGVHRCLPASGVRPQDHRTVNTRTGIRTRRCSARRAAPWPHWRSGWPRCWSRRWWRTGVPLAAAALPVLSAAIFFGRRPADHPTGAPTLFVIVFYLVILVQGLLHH
jgi:hypothetical protein